MLLLLLFWGGPVQSLKRTKNWAWAVRFRILMPSPLGIYNWAWATNVTLLLDLAESWNLFPEGIQQSASTSGAYLGEPECQGLSVEWLQKQDIQLQHGGRSLRPLHSFCTRGQRPLGRSPCVFVRSFLIKLGTHEQSAVVSFSVDCEYQALFCCLTQVLATLPAAWLGHWELKKQCT